MPRVLELLENLQKDKLIPRNLKQDLAWVTDLIQNKRIYTSGMLNNDD